MVLRHSRLVQRAVGKRNNWGTEVLTPRLQQRNCWQECSRLVQNAARNSMQGVEGCSNM